MARKFRVEIAFEQCKGCARCVGACPQGVLVMGHHLNRMSFPAVELSGNKCVGCGLCFYTCPEPGALTIFEEVEDAK
ncbi:MAG: 4Fe-4S dicluster domain-containing protein [Victivallaceae bacterium]|nr:4Fe-4S dicluster domain-containing protein [Victivallaceae bacterium]